jgi:LacI family transcriptional regulator
MPRPRKSRRHRPAPVPAAQDFERLGRPPSLTARVEQLLREAISAGRFAEGRLPTEMELAEQLGVSRETVRLAAEALQRDGLLVKIRRKGTFLHHGLPDQIETTESAYLGYLQAGYQAAQGREEAATRAISGLMLQGALEEATRAGFRLIVQHAQHTQIGQAFQQLQKDRRLRGLLFAHYGEEKLLRRAVGLGVPIVLLDHDLHLPGVHSVRDDSFAGARQALAHLAQLGHRRIAFVNWHQTELNPWRLQGYRQGLRDAGLPRRRTWELSAEITAAGARQAVSQLLDVTPRPTAVYVFNNTLGQLLIDELKARGVAVPEDMSVMGGGGEEVPGLSCHQADWYEIGRSGVQILTRSLAAGDPAKPEHLLSSHTLRAGHSAGPASSRPDS